MDGEKTKSKEMVEVNGGIQERVLEFILQDWRGMSDKKRLGSTGLND